MQIPVAGTDTGVESTVCEVEIFITGVPINHHLQSGKPPSHSATPELLQLLTPGLLSYFTLKTLIVVRKSIARWSTRSFGVCGLLFLFVYSVSYSSRSGFLPATSAASFVCGRSSS